MAYMASPETTDSCRTVKKQIYSTLLRLSTNANQPCEMRITRNNPGVVWQHVWRNLHKSGLTAPIKSLWYAAIHDILPTHDRLATINLVPVNTCPRCQNPDSVLHRIIDCSNGNLQWTWTKQKMALILRTEAKHIPKEWTTLPDLHLWPPQRHAAIIWIIAHYVYYRLQNNRRHSLRDYIDFMKRARWKHKRTTKGPNTGRYLEVLEWTFP